MDLLIEADYFDVIGLKLSVILFDGIYCWSSFAW